MLTLFCVPPDATTWERKKVTAKTPTEGITPNSSPGPRSMGQQEFGGHLERCGFLTLKPRHAAFLSRVALVRLVRCGLSTRRESLDRCGLPTRLAEATDFLRLNAPRVCFDRTPPVHGRRGKTPVVYSKLFWQLACTSSFIIPPLGS